MAAPQWMPLYVGDYLRDTSRLTTEQHGAYLLLIFDYWVNGPLPDDDAQLATICRIAKHEEWRLLRPLLSGFFRISRGFWHHKRIDFERRLRRQKTQSIHEARSNAGSKGAANRWQNNSKPNGKTMANAILRARVPEPEPERSTSSLRSEPFSSSLRSSENLSRSAASSDLWEKGELVLGKRRRSVVGKMIKLHGAETVTNALDACERTNPGDRISYFIACCEGKTNEPPPPPKHIRPSGPPPTPEEAARRWDELERLHH
jgi:uncharacterized protein YdaU (DUF1376 family)